MRRMMIEAVDQRKTLTSIISTPAASAVPPTPTMTTTPSMESATQAILDRVMRSCRKSAARIGMKMGFIAPSSEESEPVSRSIPSICRQKLAKYPVKPMAKRIGQSRLSTGFSALRRRRTSRSAGIETR